MHSVYRWLLCAQYWLWPACCVLCAGPGDARRDLCRACAAALPRNEPACPSCARPLAAPVAGIACGACTVTPPPWQRACSIFSFEPPVDRLLRELKFARRLAYGRVLGELMADKFADRAAPLPELIVPVPLHPRRWRERGYNQALELALPIARRTGVALDATLCHRIRATQAQTGLDARTRRRNVRGAFGLRGTLHCTRIAIVDDVMTTGSTVAELARTLRRAGAVDIDVWTCARAHTSKKV